MILKMISFLALLLSPLMAIAQSSATSSQDDSWWVNENSGFVTLFGLVLTVLVFLYKFAEKRGSECEELDNVVVTVNGLGDGIKGMRADIDGLKTGVKAEAKTEVKAKVKADVIAKFIVEVMAESASAVDVMAEVTAKRAEITAKRADFEYIKNKFESINPEVDKLKNNQKKHGGGEQIA